MSQTFSSFLLSHLKSGSDESEQKILDLRADVRDRLRSINNQPPDSTVDRISELAVVYRLLLDIGIQQDAVCYAELQLAILQS